LLFCIVGSHCCGVVPPLLHTEGSLCGGTHTPVLTGHGGLHALLPSHLAASWAADGTHLRHWLPCPLLFCAARLPLGCVMSLCMAACALFAVTYSGTFHWAPTYRHGCVVLLVTAQGTVWVVGLLCLWLGLQLGMGSYVGVLTHTPRSFESCSSLLPAAGCVALIRACMRDCQPTTPASRPPACGYMHL
jgi:hypothetical protein